MTADRPAPADEAREGLHPSPWRHRIAVTVGLLGLAGCVLWSYLGVPPDGLSPEALRVLGIAFCMATWWIVSDLPLPVPSLLPLAAFPLLSISDSKSVSASYADRIVLLLLSSFLLALAVERSGLHRRLALMVLSRVGDHASRLSLGVILVTSAISGWISNTAATLMMLPIVLAIVDEGAKANSNREHNDRFAAQMLLGVAWAASIGGIGTPIGTPPNLLFQAIHHEQFPEAEPVSFLAWMRFGVPIGVVLAITTWFLLSRVLAPIRGPYRFGGREMLERELSKLGAWTSFEVRAAIGFGTACLLWIVRPLLVRWDPLRAVDDTTIGALMLILFFFVPAGAGTGRNLLTWEEGRRAPWDLFLLFGGGIALSMGFEKSGLTAWLAAGLAEWATLPTPLLLLAVSALTLAVTELASNTATAAILLPVLASMAKQSGLDPLLLMVPATLMASLGFAMPVGTAPNALVIGTGRVPARTMMKLGLAIDGAALVIVVVMMLMLG